MTGRRVRDDRGFTLTELLIVIVLLGIIGGVVTTIVVTGLRQQTQVQDRGAALTTARTALQRIDRDVRASDPLQSMTAGGVAIALFSDSANATVTYSLDKVVSGTPTVVSSVTTCTVSSPCQLYSSRQTAALVTNVVHDAANTPVFQLSPSSCSDGTVGCVTSVTVTLTVQSTGQTAPVTLSDNGVELRNSGS